MKLHWGYSDAQVDRYAEQFLTDHGAKYQANGTWVHIRNFPQFSEDIRDILGITEEQRLALLYDNQKEIEYRIAYYEHPGFTPPETPHHAVQGRVVDTAGNPVYGAMVKFVSDLSVENTSLSATTVSDSEGAYHTGVVWGNRQNVIVTKEGYDPYRKSGITFTNENTTLDFTLDRNPYPSPGLSVPAGIVTVLAGWICITHRRRNYP
jgi:hypothetical protein